jgi:hypothetical protein
MGFLETFPIFSGVLLFIGLFLISGGIRITKGKRFLLVSRYTRPEVWHKPIVLTGNKAIFQGVLYIVAGILAILGAIWVYSVR